MRTVTHKTGVLIYGPQDGQVGERMRSPPYGELDGIVDDYAYHESAVSHMKLETERDHIQKQDNRSERHLNEMGTKGHNIESKDIPQGSEHVRNDTAKGTASAAPTQHAPDTPEASDCITDPIEYINVRTT